PTATPDSPTLLVLCNLPEIRSSGVPPGTATGAPNLPEGRAGDPGSRGESTPRRRAAPGPNPSANPVGARGEESTGLAPAPRRWRRITPATTATMLVIGPALLFSSGVTAPVTAHAAAPARA